MANEQTLAGRTYRMGDSHPAYQFGTGVGLMVGGIGSMLDHDKLMAAGYGASVVSAGLGYRSAKKTNPSLHFFPRSLKEAKSDLRTVRGTNIPPTHPAAKQRWEKAQQKKQQKRNK